MTAAKPDKAQIGLQRIGFAPPKDAVKALRTISVLAYGSMLSAVVHTLKPGGRQGLHAHPTYDNFYFVLKGRARFYGRDNALVVEAGPHEGVLVPRGEPYGFEAIDGEALILAVDASPSVESSFEEYEPGADAVNYEMFWGDGSRLAGAPQPTDGEGMTNLEFYTKLREQTKSG